MTAPLGNLQGINGPRAGKRTGRNRNALMNLRSKQQSGGGGQASRTTLGKKFSPALSPSDSVRLSGDLANQRLDYLNQIAHLQLQAAGVTGQEQFDLAGIQREKLLGLSRTENQALDRGVIGGSNDLVHREDVRADAAFNSQQTQFQADQQLQGVGLDRMNAENVYQAGSAQNQAERQALLQEEAISAFQQGLLGSGGVTGQHYNKLLQAQLARMGGTPKPPSSFPRALYQQLMAQTTNPIPDKTRTVRRKRRGRGGTGYVPQNQHGYGLDPYGRF